MPMTFPPAVIVGVVAIPFTVAIPLTSGGTAYMPQQTIASVLAFTVAASPVQNSSVYVRLVSDGSHVPTFTGFLEWGGSQGWNNGNGIVNQVNFFFDGVDAFFSISQAVGAVPIVAPVASSSAVANATPTVASITMSKPLDGAFVPAASAFTVGGHSVSSVAISGSTISLTVSAAFIYGEAARTVAYTQPGTNNVRDLSGILLANFAALAITNNVAAVASAISMTGPTGGVVSVASTAFTLGVTPVGGTMTGTVVVTPSDGGAGGTFTPTSVSLTNGSPTGTFTYTPSASIGAKTISATNNGGLTNPTNITYTTTAAATVPGAPTIGAATVGDASASVTFTAPGSNGGSAIIDYTVTSTPGSITATGTTSPINITGLTNGTACTFTVRARNAVGNSAESAASNSVTPAAAPTAVFLRFNTAAALGVVNETGDGTVGYTYLSGGSGWANCVVPLSTPKLAPGSWASMDITSDNGMMGFCSSASAQPYSAYNGGVWNTSGNLYLITNGAPSNIGTIASGTRARLRRSSDGVTVFAEKSSDGGATWPTALGSWTTAGGTIHYVHLATAAPVVHPRGFGMTA